MPSISGNVFIRNAAPSADVIVTAYDVSLTSKQRLGEVTLRSPFTSQPFQIRWNQSAEGRGAANVQAQASAPDDLWAGQTEMIFNAPNEVTNILLELHSAENSTVLHANASNPLGKR